MGKKHNILLIGGTGDAVELNATLYALEDVDLVTSLAGRTKDPTKLMGDVLLSGFQDVGGLEKFLDDRDIDQVIDASHPYAAQISRKALQICKKMNVPYIRFDRNPWLEYSADKWTHAADTADAAHKLEGFTNIFLTVGRQELSLFNNCEQKKFIVRTIEGIDFSPVLSEVCHLQSRGPFTVEDEISLMKAHDIDVVVSKNSGGSATYAKIEAARNLSLPVVMIRRPSYEISDVVYSLDDLLELIRPFS